MIELISHPQDNVALSALHGLAATIAAYTPSGDDTAVDVAQQLSKHAQLLHQSMTQQDAGPALDALRSLARFDLPGATLGYCLVGNGFPAQHAIDNALASVRYRIAEAESKTRLHDQWVTDQVQQALANPDDIPHEAIEAEWTAERAELQASAESARR